MATEIISVIFLLVFGGLSGLAGYLGRKAQKLEERKDVTYLEKLPTIYSNLKALQDVIQQFKDGDTISEFIEILEKTNENLCTEIFSANILIFKETLHDEIYSLRKKILTLEAVAKRVKAENHVETFRKFCKEDEKYKIGSLTINLKTLVAENENLIKNIKKELNSYSSISSRLIIIFILLGVMLAAIEIIKTVFSLASSS